MPKGSPTISGHMVMCWSDTESSHRRADARGMAPGLHGASERGVGLAAQCCATPKPAPHVLDRPLPSHRFRRSATDAR
ncbi:hypothetical protein CBM2597_A50261 [Cupriavidus taiwanensis]|nr:hypothetical protein CBM2597_A50261 [Cupriavidus taiwanensis]